MKHREEPEPPNMTPMIDIVFQMIIFFIVTLDLDSKKFSKDIELPMAPDGRPATKLNPLTMYVEVRKDGRYQMGKTVLYEENLRSMFADAARRYGPEVPVVIRGDRELLHESIADLMKIIGESGLYVIEFAATKKKV